MSPTASTSFVTRVHQKDVKVLPISASCRLEPPMSAQHIQSPGPAGVRGTKEGKGTPMAEVDIKIDDALSDQINNSAVGFLKFRDSGREARVAGSGTFVQLGKIKGSLTAGHVIDNLPETGQVGLVRPTATLQNLRIDMSHTNREMLWDKVEGHAPDLGFLKLPDHVTDDRSPGRSLPQFRQASRG
jgi:hypothetical protein